MEDNFGESRGKELPARPGIRCMARFFALDPASSKRDLGPTGDLTIHVIS